MLEFSEGRGIQLGDENQENETEEGVQDENSGIAHAWKEEECKGGTEGTDERPVEEVDRKAEIESAAIGFHESRAVTGLLSRLPRISIAENRQHQKRFQMK